MRRSFAFALASLTAGAAAVALAGPGCTTNALGVQDLCGWVADECNCYRRFAAGVADVTVAATDAQGKVVSAVGQPKCGIALDGSNNPLDPTTGTPIANATQKPTFGTFATRDQLDICILQGPQGGQIVFDPPLDVTVFPPFGFSFKIIDGSGDLCGTGSFNSTTSFSIGFPNPDGTGGGNAASGAGGGGGAGGGQPTNECRPEPPPPDQKAAPGDPEKEQITFGTFTMSGTDTPGVVTTVCPNNEVHKFNLVQLNKCDGTEAGEEAYKALLPAAEVEADAGAANKDGYVRFRVFWPPTEVEHLDGKKPIAVEYFHCRIPGAEVPCFDGTLSEGETDVDCGGVCFQGCEDGKDCLVGADCLSQVCQTNAMGFLKCVTPPCGDSTLTGLETCDDGNALSGDGCSETCQEETGYECTGTGPGSCIEIDECALGTDNCPVGTECVNIPGSFTCKCDSGFTWDGMQCVAGCGDGDLKAPEACDDGNTTNGDGCTANCTKEPGYFCMGEGPGSCVDIDECATMADTCLDTETCTNTPGSFTCTCNTTGNANKVCEGVCIDISSDVFNCGDCDKVCLPNQACVSGQCCAAPADALCGGACVDTKTDEANCGMCGVACAGTCVMGSCCAAPNTACGTQCVNTQTNAGHCGMCGNACAPGLNCVQGQCCAAPSNAVCGGACTDTQTDAANCGTCGMACPVGTTCNAGTCM